MLLGTNHCAPLDIGANIGAHFNFLFLNTFFLKRNQYINKLIK